VRPGVPRRASRRAISTATTNGRKPTRNPNTRCSRRPAYGYRERARSRCQLQRWATTPPGTRATGTTLLAMPQADTGQTSRDGRGGPSPPAGELHRQADLARPATTVGGGLPALVRMPRRR
jgi:hypothetical protein